MGQRLNDRGFHFREEQEILLFSAASGWDPPNLPSISPFPWLIQPGHEADHSLASSAQSGARPPFPHVMLNKGQLYLYRRFI